MKKQLAISLCSFSVSKSNSQNSQNKEEQEQDNEESKSRILKKVVGFFNLGKWSSNSFDTTTTRMQCTVTFANTPGVELHVIISRRKKMCCQYNYGD